MKLNLKTQNTFVFISVKFNLHPYVRQLGHRILIANDFSRIRVAKYMMAIPTTFWIRSDTVIFYFYSIFNVYLRIIERNSITTNVKTINSSKCLREKYFFQTVNVLKLVASLIFSAF